MEYYSYSARTQMLHPQLLLSMTSVNPLRRAGTLRRQRQAQGGL